MLDLARVTKKAQPFRRAKSNIKARRVYSAQTDRSTGIICDQSIDLSGQATRAHYPEGLRRIRYKDAETGNTLVFLTNHFELPPMIIAALYKNRWHVELFFLPNFNLIERLWKFVKKDCLYSTYYNHFALQTGHLILSRSNSNHTQDRPRVPAFPPLPDL